jgi:hypothetical protein
LVAAGVASSGLPVDSLKGTQNKSRKEYTSTKCKKAISSEGHTQFRGYRLKELKEWKKVNKNEKSITFHYKLVVLTKKL